MEVGEFSRDFMTGSLADEILRRLIEAEGKPLSGQKLATDLGVTRAAVWKGVNSLRAKGCRVSSEPSRGYTLASSPGDLRPGEVAARLRTERFGRSLRHLARLDSTNREADRWAQQGAPEGSLVVAELQEAGRGRLGRSWYGLPGKSLLFSLVLRPDVHPSDAPLLTFVASVALAETITAWVPAPAIEIKWPNDVLISGRKAAGILLEMRTEGQRVDSVVLGVGVNVEGSSADFPAELRETAITAEEAAPNKKPDRLAFLCHFLEVFEEAYDLFLAEGFGPLSVRWNEWFRMVGQSVRVRTAAGVAEGVAKTLGARGALVLERAPGDLTEIYAGDVEFATTRTP
jgi:BirA family biotin operon repressor/biotin-[acetyl-CoA-carboxylase] ligase